MRSATPCRSTRRRSWPSCAASMWSLTFEAATWPPAAKARRWCRHSIAPCSRRPGEATAVLNLGGIANLSAIDADGSTIGFDSGPANALLDFWCAASTGRRFDAGGAWAAAGKVDVAVARRAAGRTLLRPAAAEKHGPRPVQRRLARGSPARHRSTHAAAGAGRPGDAGRADGANRRRRRPPPRRAGEGTGRLRRRRLQRRPDAPARAPSSRRCRWYRAPSAGCRPTRWKPAPSPGWHGPSSAASRATSPSVTGAAGPRVLGALYPGRGAASDMKKPPRGGFRRRTGRIRRRSSSRSRRSWSRSGS